MKIKTRQPGRSEARWSSKKKGRRGRDLQNISNVEAVSCIQQHSAAKAYQWQTQHQTNKREESPKLCNNQEVNTVKAEVSSGEDTNAEDIGTPQTKITETSLRKDSNANQKHANPYISPHITHQTGSEDQKHINCSWNSLHQTRHETTQMEENGRPQSKKTLRP